MSVQYDSEIIIIIFFLIMIVRLLAAFISILAHARTYVQYEDMCNICIVNADQCYTRPRYFQSCEII